MATPQKVKEELLKTAMILEGFGKLQKAAHYYAQAEEYAKSAKLYERLGDFKKAGDSYYAARKLPQALKMYLRTGRKDKKIAILYEKTGNFRKAAEIWKLLKSNRNRKRCLLQSRQLSLFDLKL
jgi:tetratricopeptide (TPR) repeat protein